MRRREFIKQTATGAAAVATLGGYAMGAPKMNAARILGANDRVRVAVVGSGDRSMSALVPAFQASAKDLNMELVAVCDIWNYHRDKAAGTVKSKYGLDVAKVRNTDELYARKDIDAVLIGTADFQHAYHCTEAVNAGRDVYVEKPLAHRMQDARRVLDAVKKSGKIVQVGTQRRTADNYANAAKFIQEGKFGDVKFVEVTWNVNQPLRWRRPELVAKIRKEDTDWDRFLIDYPKDKWDPRKYLEFRLFWPYSSGIPDQWMVHQIDTVHWLCQDPYPESVVASGDVMLWKDGRTNPDTWTAVFNYPKGFQVLYTSRQTNDYGGVKEIFCSNLGTINLDTNEITGNGGLEAKYSLDKKDHRLASAKIPSTTKAAAEVDTSGDSTGAHMRNWMDCVRSRKQPNAPIEAGYQHSVALCMSIEATHTGRRARFNAETQEVVTE